jgi:TrmH family RNA methyltransferase
VQRITSRQNAVVARYRDAARGGTAQMLLDGPHLVAEALSAATPLRHALVALDAVERPDVAPLVDRLVAAGVEVVLATAPVIDAASPVRSSSPIVALGDRPADAGERSLARSSLAAILCEIQDPGNVGAIIRVAEGAGAGTVVLVGACADPFGWKALRASMGSALRLPLTMAPDVDTAVRRARQHGARIVASVPRGGVPLFDADLAGTIALLVGGEGAGVPQAALDGADLRVTIPMAGAVESLNTAVAAALLLYEAVRQRTRRGREALAR